MAKTLHHWTVELPLFLLVVGLYLMWFARWSMGQWDNDVATWGSTFVGGLVLAAVGCALLTLAVFARLRSRSRERLPCGRS